jgi:hypothetical protein
LSKTHQKNDSEKLYPEEEEVVKRVLSGKEKLYKFDNANEVIKHLNKLASKKK